MAVENISIKKSLLEDNDDNTQPVNSHIGVNSSSEKYDEHFGAGRSTLRKRPTNLQDLILGDESLTCDNTEANFSLEDISDGEDIWVFDVPKTINPKNFKGQVIKLGKKNDFQIGNKVYETSSIAGDDEQHLSVVFNTGRRKRPYKTVNLKPAGSVRIRQKLSSLMDPSLVSPKKVCVPFPRNLKLRHPLFGHDYNEKLVAVDK